MRLCSGRNNPPLDQLNALAVEDARFRHAEVLIDSEPNSLRRRDHGFTLTGGALAHLRFFFLFRSFGACHPLFFVLIIGPPGIPMPLMPPPMRLFMSLSLPIIPMPPTARIMLRLISNCFMNAPTSCTSQ